MSESDKLSNAYEIMYEANTKHNDIYSLQENYSDLFGGLLEKNDDLLSDKKKSSDPCD